MFEEFELTHREFFRFDKIISILDFHTRVEGNIFPKSIFVLKKHELN